MVYLAWGIAIVIGLGLVFGSLALIITSLDFILYGDRSWQAFLTGTLGVAYALLAAADYAEQEQKQ